MDTFIDTFDVLIDDPWLWMVLTLASFLLMAFLQSKIRSDFWRPLLNPIFFSAVFIIAFLLITDIPFKKYYTGGKYIQLFIAPATVALGIKLEENLSYLKKYYPAILIGIFAGAIFHTLLIIGFGLWFNFEYEMIASLYPKSITTAIAIGVADSIQGITSLAVAAVILAGIATAVVGEPILKLFKITHPVAQGISLGSAGHAVGTAKAIEMGDVQGAMASLAIIVTGLTVVLLAPFIPIILEWFI